MGFCFVVVVDAAVVPKWLRVVSSMMIGNVWLRIQDVLRMQTSGKDHHPKSLEGLYN